MRERYIEERPTTQMREIEERSTTQARDIEK